jgi:hypothetical protein
MLFLLKTYLKWIFIVFLACFVVPVVLAATGNSECIAKYKTKLLKGGWDYGFFCEYGSTFTRFKINSDQYIIYDYIYRFMPADGNVMHGGQRLLFFNLHYDYLGQFSMDVPPYIKILQSNNKNKLILTDGKQPVGYIILSSPPESMLYGENLHFYK